MKKNLPLGLLMFLPVLFTSCAKYFSEEEEETNSKTMTTLRVIPRSGSEVALEYPIKIYAFNEKGNCTSQQTIESSEDSPSFSLALPKGNYRIVALSGITEDEYIFPGQPSLTDVIEMRQGNKTKIPLMMGNATVNLDGTTTAKANITLNYMVAQLKIALSNIPSGSSNVKVEITSSYSQLSYSGEYSNGGNSSVASCELIDNNIWDTGIFYTFAGSEKNTIFSIHMTSDKEEETYGYTYNNTIQASQPYILKGSYEKLIATEGNISFAGWADPINVDFSFGGNSEDSKPDSDDEDDANKEPSDIFTVDEIPEEETIWRNCFVLEVTPNEQGNETEVLLMGIKNVTNAKGEEKMYSTQAEAALEKYNIDDIYNWRIPTEKEALLLKSKYNNEKLSVINKIISSAKGTELVLESPRYLCSNATQSFNLKSNQISNVGNSTRYYLRPVKTIHMVKQ